MGREHAPKKPEQHRQARIHPDLYRKICHEAIDMNKSFTERLHDVLCGALERTDLIGQPPGAGRRVHARPH